jgi:F-type H+-transporting ATPase subunit b
MSEFERTRESRNNAAKQEAAEIVKAAKDDAKSIINQGKIESQQIVDSMILNAKKEIKSEREQMLSDTKCEIGQLVADIAEKLLISQMTENQKNAYVALAEKMICTKDVA